jgi:hypothetical protein
MADTDARLTDAITALNEQETAIVAGMQKFEARLSQVRTARASLLAMESEEPIAFDENLTEACRTVLRSSTDSFSPTEVRDKVKALGYDLSKHDNQMAAIHGVLKRIVESGDAKTKEAKDGSGTRYFWVGSSSEHRPKRRPIEALIEAANSTQAAWGTVMTRLGEFHQVAITQLRDGNVEEALRTLGKAQNLVANAAKAVQK